MGIAGFATYLKREYKEECLTVPQGNTRYIDGNNVLNSLADKVLNNEQLFAKYEQFLKDLLDGKYQSKYAETETSAASSVTTTSSTWKLKIFMDGLDNNRTAEKAKRRKNKIENILRAGSPNLRTLIFELATRKLQEQIGRIELIQAHYDADDALIAAAEGDADCFDIITNDTDYYFLSTKNIYSLDDRPVTNKETLMKLWNIDEKRMKDLYWAFNGEFNKVYLTPGYALSVSTSNQATQKSIMFESVEAWKVLGVDANTAYKNCDLHFSTVDMVHNQKFGWAVFKEKHENYIGESVKLWTPVVELLCGIASQQQKFFTDSFNEHNIFTAKQLEAQQNEEYNQLKERSDVLASLYILLQGKVSAGALTKFWKNSKLNVPDKIKAVLLKSLKLLGMPDIPLKHLCVMFSNAKQLTSEQPDEAAFNSIAAIERGVNLLVQVDQLSGMHLKKNENQHLQEVIKAIRIDLMKDAKYGLVGYKKEKPFKDLWSLCDDEQK